MKFLLFGRCRAEYKSTNSVSFALYLQSCVAMVNHCVVCEFGAFTGVNFVCAIDFAGFCIFLVSNGNFH